MSRLEAIYVAAIVIVGVPSALRLRGRFPHVRNATALAMVVTWIACRVIYDRTGIKTPIEAMILSDAAVIAAMFAKQDWITCSYRSARHQLACLWHERTPWDKGILALFPVVWLFYVPLVDPYYQYRVLWTLSMAQLALAGLEALYQWQRVRGHALRADAPGEPPGSLFAPVSGGAYG